MAPECYGICGIRNNHGPSLSLNALSLEHQPRWNPDLEEWFCSICGRTSDHKLEADARAELDAFECRIIGVQSREYTEEEISKWRVTKKMRNKF